MKAPISPPPKNANRKAIFNKWKRWRNRLRLEFLNLLVKQSHFHELQAISKPYIGTEIASELARSMAQGYAAFAFTAIRRIAEFPKPKTPKAREIVTTANVAEGCSSERTAHNSNPPTTTIQEGDEASFRTHLHRRG